MSSAVNRVLVVDDDAGVRGLVAAVLRRHRVDVAEAASGAEAIAHIDAEHYDAVILDLMMPGGSGFDVIAHIQRTKTVLPCIVISAASQQTIDRARAEPGVHAVLRKPFDIQELVREVRACIQ
jgi:DNA-binding response OmpR family regulator